MSYWDSFYINPHTHMKKAPLLHNWRALAAVMLASACVAGASEPQVTQTIFPDRPAVKAEVERLFDLDVGMDYFEDLSLTNPGTDAIVVLSSYSQGVSFMVTIYEKPDDEVQADLPDWVFTPTAPPYVQGTAQVKVTGAQTAAMEQLFDTAEYNYSVGYWVNHNSDNEVAAYDKSIQARLPKADEPDGSELIMNILDNILNFNWQQDTTKEVVTPPEE